MDGDAAIVAGGVESISGLKPPVPGLEGGSDPWIVEHKPALYMAMIDTADIVAERYREARVSPEPAHRAAQEPALREESSPSDTMPSRRPRRRTARGDLDRDTCSRPGTTYEALAKLEPVKGPGKFITAGNASQLSDGASACVMVEARAAERAGVQALGALRGFAVAGCEPDEMGIGPVFAVPKLLQHHGLKVEDIGLWELNEAFASQAIYCRDRLGIPDEVLNVDGGSIAIGHPFGMTGARLAGHVCSRAGAGASSTRWSRCASRAAWRCRPVRNLLKNSG
jgi:acetyl-CoA acetyltransferase family protein